MSKADITVYGAHWCPDCRRSKQFLGEHQIPYNWVDMDGAFIFIGLVPNTGFLETSSVLLDRWGFIVTGHALLHGDDRPMGFKHRDPLLLETSVPGVFAAGDVRDTSTKQVVSAAGEGSTAALMVREYLKGV